MVEPCITCKVNVSWYNSHSKMISSKHIKLEFMQDRACFTGAKNNLCVWPRKSLLFGLLDLLAVNYMVPKFSDSVRSLNIRSKTPAVSDNKP